MTVQRRFDGVGMRRTSFRDEHGGGPASISPLDVPTLTLALVKNTGITGDPASAWADQSGGGRNFGQGSVPSQADVTVAGALAFDGVDDYMGDQTLGNLIDGDGWTAWLVMSVDGAAPTGATPGIVCVPSTVVWGLFCQRIAGVDYMRFHQFSGGIEATPDIAVTLGTLYAVRARYDGTTLYLRVGGVETSIATGAPASLAGTVRIGVGGTHFSPPMTLHDVYVFDSHLDAETLAGVDQWMREERGATV